VLRRTPFLNLSTRISHGGAQGLLSMAFSPGYARNHLFYVDYTNVRGDTRVVEYQSDGQKAIGSSARIILSVHQPFDNHNGGQLEFGPDGRLYVGMGDGGSGGDPDDNGQNPSTFLAKLIAADPAAATPNWQIVGFGLRNPWRVSFDRLTGALYIGDVGQDSREEIDYRRPGAPPANYGWSRFEGTMLFKDTPLDPTYKLVFPVVEYTHSDGCAVIGGYAYRGSAVPAVAGRYFYGDLCSGTIWSFEIVNHDATDQRTEAFTLSSLVSFGEDADGEVYLVSHDGSIWRLAA